MKKYILLSLIFCANAEEKHFVIDICSYNNAQWYERNLDSVLRQNYPYFRVIYTDDCSPDGTGKLVEDYLAQHDKQGCVTLIKNTKRRRALANHYNAIHSCDDDEIVLTLDGDDWLRDEHVLAELNELYQDPDVWFAYSTFSNWPKQRKDFVYSRAVPHSIITRNGFRSYTWVCGQLRSFYVWLAKCVKFEDLLLSRPLSKEELDCKRFTGMIEKLSGLEMKRAYHTTAPFQGLFFPSACDVALMTPMLELAGEHVKYIDDPIYIRNLGTEINDHKVDPSAQKYCARYIRTFKEYSPLASPVKRQSLIQNQKPTILMFPSPGSRVLLNSEVPASSCSTVIDVLNRADPLTFKQSLEEKLKSCGPYILAARNDQIDSLFSSIDMSECIMRLEQTFAHACFFYEIDPSVPVEQLFNTSFFCWQYVFGVPAAGPAIYRKESVFAALERLDIVTVEALWEALPGTYTHERSIGLIMHRALPC